jgi:hypothetical protein
MIPHLPHHLSLGMRFRRVNAKAGSQMGAWQQVKPQSFMGRAYWRWKAATKPLSLFHRE